MEKKEFYLKVIRHSTSYDYKHDVNKNDYQNNTKNNAIDTMLLYYNDDVVFICSRVQTISNHPSMKHLDTIKAGNFQIKCFVKQGGYNTPIHGIINATDLNNQKIDKYSMQKDAGQYIGRWLIHSSYYKPLKKDTRGYSGGCFIMSTDQMNNLNYKLKKMGIVPGDIINGCLEEE